MNDCFFILTFAEEMDLHYKLGLLLSFIKLNLKNWLFMIWSELYEKKNKQFLVAVPIVEHHFIFI